MTPEIVRRLDRTGIEKRVSFDSKTSDKISSPEKSVFRTQSLNQPKKSEVRQVRMHSLKDDYLDNSEETGSGAASAEVKTVTFFFFTIMTIITSFTSSNFYVVLRRRTL